MNPNNPKVSVIVLTYNSEAFVGRALFSLRRQTLRDIEIVVVDAGSVDRTKDIVCSSGDVTWLDLPGSDMGMARNYGVRNSKGSYLMFLDSDDFYLPFKVESQVAAMEARTDLDAIFSPAYIYRTGQMAKLGVKAETRNLLTLADFLKGNCYTLGTICIRRSAWNRGLSFGEDELGRYGEDWRFQLNMARHGFMFDVLDVPAVVVEIRPGSHTSWAIQPTMKELALVTVEGILNALGKEKLNFVNRQTLLDEYRFKLAVSLILVGRTTDAQKVLKNINSSKKLLSARILLGLDSVLPTAWVREVLQLIWTVRQNSTFSWSRPSADIARQISELNIN